MSWSLELRGTITSSGYDRHSWEEREGRRRAGERRRESRRGEEGKEEGKEWEELTAYW